MILLKYALNKNEVYDWGKQFSADLVTFTEEILSGKPSSVSDGLIH